jgi:hypothetical protein
LTSYEIKRQRVPDRQKGILTAERDQHPSCGPDCGQGDTVFVYGNGKWHKVRNVMEAAKISCVYTYCGNSYNDYCNTSQDESIRESRYFCSRCFIEMSRQPDDETSKPP